MAVCESMFLDSPREDVRGTGVYLVSLRLLECFFFPFCFVV